MSTLQAPPLSLYLHTPWCVRKCPYCDFNSHTAPEAIPEQAYLEALLADLDHDLNQWTAAPVQTVFIGGGTPSLMSPGFYRALFRALGERLDLSQLGEVTLEANPGTFEQARFEGYREAGINRLSLGIQSFQDHHLRRLGRIHDSANARAAVLAAQRAGFERINLDLMHGLPDQTPAEACDDLDQALAFATGHISWYQLTLEPNTAFYSEPPDLPDETVLEAILEQGRARLENAGLRDYEVSAWSRPGDESRHNLNYWQFGDYLALGAGGHGKITLPDEDRILRYWKTRQPEAYLQRIGSRTAGVAEIDAEERALEFMMNALRLRDGVPADYLTQRAGDASPGTIDIIRRLINDGLLIEDYPHRLATTTTGQRYLNDVLEAFMP